MLMDAGAGGGYYSMLFLDRRLAGSVVAVEPFEENYRILESNLSRYEGRARTVHAPIERCGLGDSSMDTVLCTQVVEHIEDDSAVAREFGRVLRPGGHALITVPHPPEAFPQPGHVREGYTAETLERLFATAGFEALDFDWAMTQTTVRRFKAIARLPRLLRIVPPALWAREDTRSREDRRDDQPFCLLGLFRKA